MADVHGYGIVRSDCLFIPYLLINLVYGEYLACVFHQKQQNIVLNRSELDKFSVNIDLLVVIVDGESASFIYRLRRIACDIAKLHIAS